MDTTFAALRSSITASLLLSAATCLGGTIINGSGLSGGLRWDAAPFTIAGQERSLDGGLRYSIQGGSYEFLRDRFTWNGATPSVPDFTDAVKAAFAAWESVDPATGLGTDIRFVEDLSTTARTDGFGDVNFFGAEIDLFGLDGGADGRRGVASWQFLDRSVTLTSGTTNYAGSTTTIGVDIALNTNPDRQVWTLDLFRRVLTHEIGHAIGLGDVENSIDPEFIDDNFDGSSSVAAAATLSNSWALLVDPFDPSASPLSVVTVPEGDPGLMSPGVDLLMESFGTGIGLSNPVERLVPLTNDEFSMRQFLYPSFIPEPSSLALAFSFLVAATKRRRVS